VPHVYRVLEEAGGVARGEMFRAFNMGVGLVVISDTAGAAAVMKSAGDHGIGAWAMGEVVQGSGTVILNGGDTR
jgi:phosphoribosylformylglycinamidine cyclo-ligase